MAEGAGPRKSIRGLGVALATLVLLGGCTGGSQSRPGGPDATAPTPTVISGVAQKGPFIRGTSVTVQELDASLSPTGRTFDVTTKDDEGDFDVPVNLASRYVEVITNGYYFDELTNHLSSAPLTLRAIADVSGNGLVNVNLLTSMSDPLVRSLVSQGISFVQATSQAEATVLSAIGFSAPLGTSFTHVGLTGTAPAAATLLAASLIVEQYALSLGPSEVAQLAQILSEIGAAAADAGEGDTTLAALNTALCATAAAIDVNAVRANLTAFYASLGISLPIPPFESLISAAAACRDAGPLADAPSETSNDGNVSEAGDGASLDSGTRDATVADATTDSDVGDSGLACLPPPDAGVPPTVVANLGSSSPIIVRGGYIYWTTASSMLRKPLSGGSAQVIVSNQSFANFVVDDANVYWTNASGSVGQILKCSASGCGNSPTLMATVATSTPYSYTLTTDGRYLYWTDTNLYRCEVSGCNQNPTDLQAGGYVTGVVTDGVNVYFGVLNGGHDACPISGCGGAPTRLAPGPDAGWLFVTNGKYLYWNSYQDGSIVACAVTGCGGNPTVLAPAGAPFSAGTADESGLYWTTGSAVMFVPVGASSPIQLVSSPSSASIAKDGSALYWTSSCGVDCLGCDCQTASEGGTIDTSCPDGG